MSEEAVTHVRVCRVDELPPGSITRVQTSPAIAVYNVDGQFYATSDLCSHDKSSLSEDGYIENGEVECGWHFAKFCIKTGDVTAPPAREPLRTYDVQIDGDDIHVLVPQVRPIG
jgi:nitrite reductase/ring-hydroxylating ferredoxin subunit